MGWKLFMSGKCFNSFLLCCFGVISFLSRKYDALNEGFVQNANQPLVLDTSGKPSDMYGPKLTGPANKPCL